jgi:16S rRNA (guanine966-N2)-methyltransferase
VKPGSVRIIGGRWRGRRVPVVDAEGLRPSGDRCRETLFNWLQPHVAGARCADLFAGTGALGMEAASRGAAEVILVEQVPVVVQALRSALVDLGLDQVPADIRLAETDALKWLLSREPASLDIVFIDPPFGSRLESRALDLLAAHQLLREGALVYVETALDGTFQHPGPGWGIVKERTMGGVRMLLLKQI